MSKNTGLLIKFYLDGSIDRQYGTDTRGRIELCDLAFENPHKKVGVYYEPTPRRTFAKFMSHLPRSLKGFTFLDFGCGKGRVLLYAGAYDFERILGVEFSPELAGTAAQNLQLYGRKTGDRRLSVRCEDAIETEIPPAPCVLYFYNPFKLEILKRVAEKIRESYASNPRKIYIIYYNPAKTIPSSLKQIT